MSELILDWRAAAQAGATQVGGKGWPLALLAEFGAPVPPGFVIAADANTARRSGEALAPSLVQALSDELQRRGWTELPLVVRSSAAAEDSAGASFAGIYRSLLNVRGIAALVTAVQAVLDSASTPAAQAYRARMGLAERENTMAVVVMPLLPAQASGVAFSIDPSHGRLDQLLIEATWGLGEALVGGHSAGDQYRLQQDRDQNWTLLNQRCGSKAQMSVTNPDGDTRLQKTPSELAGKFVLSPAQALQLGAMVREVASALHYTQPYIDVEWVWDGAAFWIVQARPITALSQHTYPALAKQPRLWSRGNSRDVVPEPFPALDWSISEPIIQRMLIKSAELAGYQPLPGLRRTCLHQGRLYFETSVLQWEAFDAFDLPPKTYNQLMGGHHSEIQVPAKTLAQRLRRAGHGLRFLLKIIRPRVQAATTLNQAHQQARRLLALALPGTLTALTEQFRAQISQMREAEPLMLLQVSGSAFVVLLELMEQRFPGEGSALTAALLSGGEASVTGLQSAELMQLAAIVAREPAALAWLKSPQRKAQDWHVALPADSVFRRAFEAFLARFGHRGTLESYLHRPRWHEDPSYLFDTVLSLIECDATAFTARQQALFGAAQLRIKQLPIWQRPFVQWLVRRARHERNVREGARSALIAYSAVLRRLVLRLAQQLTTEFGFAAELVFHLSAQELLALAEQRLAATAATERAVFRRQQYQSFEQQAVAEVILEAREGVAPEPAQTTSLPPLAANEWRGLVVGAGQASGYAFIAKHPNDTLRMPVGAILVAPATDPSWTPAFIKAAGIIMETGGYLSHGAIVAREFGIPAVVNVVGILGALQCGDFVEVDAQRGIIRRLAQEKLAPLCPEA